MVAGGAHSSETGPIFSPGTDGCALLVVTFTSSLSTTLRGVLGAAAPSEGHLLGLLPPVTSGWVGGSLMEAACVDTEGAGPLTLTPICQLPRAEVRTVLLKTKM